MFDCCVLTLWWKVTPNRVRLHPRRRDYLMSTQAKLFVRIHVLNPNDFRTIMTVTKWSTRWNVWLFELDASVKRCIQNSAFIIMVARKLVDDRSFFPSTLEIVDKWLIIARKIVILHEKYVTSTSKILLTSRPNVTFRPTYARNYSRFQIWLFLSLLNIVQSSPS